MALEPYDFHGFTVIDMPAPDDAELFDMYEDGLWAPHALDVHGDGFFPFIKITREDSGKSTWIIGESWTSFDKARATAAEYAAHVLQVQDPEVRDAVFVRHFVTRTLVRINVP